MIIWTNILLNINSKKCNNYWMLEKKNIYYHLPFRLSSAKIFASIRLKALRYIFHRFLYIKFTHELGNTFRAVQNNFVHLVVNYTVYYILYYCASFHLHSGCSFMHFVAIVVLRIVASFLFFEISCAYCYYQSSGIILVLKQM
jgi:hypothetical protein